MDAIEIARAIRAKLGMEDELGTCRDCGGSGVVPNFEQTQATGPGIWQTCPTCKGNRRGGIA